MQKSFLGGFSLFFLEIILEVENSKKKKSYLTLILLILYEMGLQEIQETEQYIFFHSD